MISKALQIQDTHGAEHDADIKGGIVHIRTRIRAGFNGSITGYVGSLRPRIEQVLFLLSIVVILIWERSVGMFMPLLIISGQEMPYMVRRNIILWRQIPIIL